MADLQQRINYSERGFMGFGRWRALLPEEPEWYYCTNDQGEGLFRQWRDSGAVKQVLGLGQFTPTNFDHFKRLMRKMRNEKRANAEITPSERLEKLGSVLGRMLRVES